MCSLTCFSHHAICCLWHLSMLWHAAVEHSTRRYFAIFFSILLSADVWVVCPVFHSRWQCCYEHSCMWLLGPWSRVALRLLLGPKVYTFSACLDNTELIFPRGSQLPTWSPDSSLLRSSSGSIRPTRKGLPGTAREKPISLQCHGSHFWVQEVTTWPRRLRASVQPIDTTQDPIQERALLTPSQKPSENQTDIWKQHSE